jgi:hypothetical protein
MKLPDRQPESNSVQGEACPAQAQSVIVATRIKALLRRDPLEAQMTCMRQIEEFVASSDHPDAIEARACLDDARIAAKEKQWQKFRHHLRTAWKHASDFEAAIAIDALQAQEAAASEALARETARSEQAVATLEAERTVVAEAPRRHAQNTRKDGFHDFIWYRYDALVKKYKREPMINELRKALLDAGAEVRRRSHRGGEEQRDVLVLFDQSKELGQLLNTDRALRDALERAKIKRAAKLHVELPYD